MVGSQFHVLPMFKNINPLLKNRMMEVKILGKRSWKYDIVDRDFLSHRTDFKGHFC